MLASKHWCGLALGVLASVSACGRRGLPEVHGKHPGLGLDDDADPGPSKSYILPRAQILPYTQWMANDGYCGELSSVQAGMGAGQWMSQHSARLICGAGLSQSGPDGFCAANGGKPDYNAQLLFERPNPGDQPFASSETCLANAHLDFRTFDYAHQPPGVPGYEQFLVWVKGRILAGDTVAIGVLDRGGDDPQYDHEVTVARIGTDHDPKDAAYYGDDVLFLEDHGAGGPAFSHGYTFASLAQTREGANASSANAYSILIPGGDPVHSGTGGDGLHVNAHEISPANYGFAVSGPADELKETLPVAVTLVGSSLAGVPNLARDGVGFNYESPAIGEAQGTACTNVPPAWMGVTLQVVVGGLTPGVAYNLYEYDATSVAGVDRGAALNVPDAAFNARAALATKVTRFVAQASTVAQTVATTSDHVVVFRAVPADAP